MTCLGILAIGTTRGIPPETHGIRRWSPPGPPRPPSRALHLSSNLHAFLNQLLVNLGNVAGCEMEVAGKVLLAAALAAACLLPGARKLRRGYR